MTKADVQYLKHRTITNAFVLNENKQIPKDPNLPEYQKDAMDEFFEDIKFLSSFIGCNIFLNSPTKKNSLYSIQKEESVMPKDLQFFRFYNFER